MNNTHDGYDLFLNLAEKLMRVREGDASDAGTKTTLIDTNMIDPPIDNHPIGGTIFIDDEDSVGIITDWDQGTTTFTFVNQVADRSAATASGDHYHWTYKDFTYWDLLTALNETIRNLPPLPKTWEDGAFVTVANQADYTIQPELPTVINELHKVWIATDTASPYFYVECPFWHIVNTNTLRFNVDAIPNVGDLRIRLGYPSYPAQLSNYQSDLDAKYDIEWVTWDAAWRAMRSKMKEQKGHSKFTIADYEAAVGHSVRERAQGVKKLPRMWVKQQLSPLQGI